MAKKKSEPKHKRPSFNRTLKDQGTNPDGGNTPSYNISQEQISRLEAALKGIEVVDHKPVYEPVMRKLRKYKGLIKSYGNIDQTLPDEGLSKELLDTLFNGIYNGLNFIVHVSKQGGFGDFRCFIEDSKYKDTMEARIEYMDALIDLAHTTSMQRKRLLEQMNIEVKGKATYKQSDLLYWKGFKENFLSAVKYAKKQTEENINHDQRIKQLDKSAKKYQKDIRKLEKTKKNYSKTIATAIKSAYQAGNLFSKVTFQLADKGIGNLFNSEK